MYTHRRLASAALLISMSAAVSFAQSITSAHSGLLHYFEGAVSIDGQTVDQKVGKFSEIKENSVLSTAQGRAEILLTPGVYLRVGENSSVKMLDNRLLSTRVELLSGTALVESDDPEVSVKDPAVTIVYKDYEIQPVKYGIFELSSETGQMKVFKGQANIAAVGATHTVVHEGHAVSFSAALLTEKFDTKQADDLYLWARDRAGALSAANLSSARSLSANGYSLNNLYMGGMYPGLGFNSGMMGGWYFNQSLGSYAYLPYGGTFYSPFGYGLFSPTTIYSYYTPGGYTWYGGTGARSTSFVPQPVAGAFTAGRPTAPGRVTAGLPLSGSGSGTVGLARTGLSLTGGRFGGVTSSNNGSGFSAATASTASTGFSGFSGGGSGAGMGSGGGFSGGGSRGGGSVGGGHAK